MGLVYISDSIQDELNDVYSFYIHTPVVAITLLNSAGCKLL